jgi:hypothetical protein
MSFFYDLNKKLAAIAGTPLNESKAKPDFLDKDHDGNRKESFKQAVKDAEVSEGSTGDYSAKKARAGKDIGKPGKAFSKIAADAGKRYGSKAAGERVAGAVLNKLRHPKESMDESDSGKHNNVARYIVTYTDNKKPGQKRTTEVKATSTAAAKSAFADWNSSNRFTFVSAKAKVDEGDMEEGAGIMHFKAQQAKKSGQDHFKLGNKEYPVKDIDEEKSKGTAFDLSTPSEVKPRVGSVERGHKHDIEHTATGRRVTRRVDPQGISVGADDESDAQAAPRGRGRPKGPAKAPERVTAKATKHKGGRRMADEDLDTDGVMMTRASNMSSESRDPGEYDQEGSMAKDDIHTIVRHARALEKILGDNDNLPEWVQAKLAKIEGMMTAVDDYMQAQRERDMEYETGEEGITMEKAPPGAKAERMVKHIKKAYSKDGKLTPKEKAIAYATTWKAHKQGKVEEESTETRDKHAERAGRKVTKDLEYDMHHTGKDDAKAERAGRKVTKDIEYDEKKKKVKETTTAGSVATSTGTTKSKGGFAFGKGVYESLDQRYKQALNEGMTINVNMDDQGHNTLNVTATEEDALALAQLLKMAGLGSKGHGCPSCGEQSCGCDQMVDENNPNWPTNTETSHDAMQYSGGLNGPKSTGQTTTPVIASQMRRQHSMEESVKLERSLFNTWKNYKG